MKKLTSIATLLALALTVTGVSSSVAVAKHHKRKHHKTTASTTTTTKTPKTTGPHETVHHTPGATKHTGGAATK